MNLTDEHLKLLYGAWVAAQKGGGVVLDNPGGYPPAHDLAEQGWLERRFVGDDLAWFWTAQADTALGLSAIMQSAETGRN